jgi:gliding motility-associated-like protein
MKYMLKPLTPLLIFLAVQWEAAAQCEKPVIIADDATACSGGKTYLHTKDIPGATYLWSDGATTASRQAGAGKYAVTVTIGGCEKTSDTITIRTVQAPMVYADKPLQICTGESITFFADTGNTWRRKPDMPADGRSGAVSVSIGSKAYMGTGTATGRTNDWWEYDDASGLWTQKADFPGQARSQAIGFAINKKAYVGLGATADVLGVQDFYEYDPFTNSWSAKADFPGAGVYSAVAFSAGNKGYAGLGLAGPFFAEPKFWAYDPATDSWSQIANFPGSKRQAAVAFSINGKGYVTCGVTDAPGPTNDCWEYDPATNSWAAQPPLPGAGRNMATGFNIGSRGYVLGGLGSVAAELWEFHNNTWTKRANYPGANQSLMSAFGFSERALVFGGSAQNKEVWEYRPDYSLEWSDGSTGYSYTTNLTGFHYAVYSTPKGCIPSAIFNVTKAGVSTAIAINGHDTICEKDSVKLSAASGDNWTQKNNFPTNVYFACGMSIGNLAYIASGNGGTQLKFRKYDPSTDTWTQLPDLPMTYLAASQGIAWRGKLWAYGSDRSMYMFDPVTEVWTKKAVCPIQVTNAQTFLLNDQIFLCGGANGSTSFKEVYAYDLVNDNWARKNDMPYIVGSGVAFALHGKGYVCTGNSNYGSVSGTPHSAVFLQYDPASDSWTELPPFPGGPRGAGIQFSDGYKAYVGLGNNNGNVLGDIWEFDPVTLSWTRMTDIPIGRFATQAFVAGRYAYIVGGHTTGPRNDVWQYELPHHYQWSDGRTGKSIWVKETGEYGLTVTSHTGCTATGTPAKIKMLPTTRIVQHPADTAVCADASLQFAGNATGDEVTFQWQFNGNDLSDDGAYTGTQTDQLSIGEATVPGVFRLIANGTCGADTSMEATLTVWALPSKPVITPDGPTTFCEGDAVTLASSATNGNTWSTGANGQDITVSTAGTYTVSVTDNNGCTSPVSDAVTVTVNPVPDKPAITAGGDLDFCEGGTVTLNSSAGATYTWSNGATTQAIDVHTAGSYTVQVTDANGCVSPASDPVTITVSPNPPQPVITAGGPLEFCAGNNVMLSTAPAAQYHWSNGSSSQSITVNQSGNYTVQIRDANGCISPASASVTVTVHPLPTGTISTRGPLVADNTRYMELQAPQLPGATYRWNTGDSTANIRVSQSGYYRVTVTNATGCAQSFDINVELIDLTKIPNTFTPNRDGINDYWSVPNLHLFPQARVSIFNRNGNKVFEATGGNIRWDGTSNGKELPAGVYYYILDLRDGGQPVNGWINLMK